MTHALHVIVRSAAERTADYCCTDLVRQTTSAQVERIESAPFWRTLREGLEHGLASGSEWVLSVDADVIPAPDAVQRIPACLEKADAEVGVITCLIQDKLMGGMRFGGVRIYRARAIPVLLEVMPPQGADVRPETATINRAATRGWRELQVPALLGIHDYEQYYRDLYRKAFLHMQKHGYMAARFLPAWKEKAALDADFRAVLAGAGDALFQESEVDCDVQHTAYKPEEALVRIGLTEKGPFSYDSRRYEGEIRAWQEDLDTGRAAPIAPPDQLAHDRTLPEDHVVQRIERMGEQFKLYAGFSDKTRAAALHQARRALSDVDLLDTFSAAELIQYANARFLRRWRQ